MDVLYTYEQLQKKGLISDGQYLTWVNISAHTGRNKCVMILNESCLVEVDRVNRDSDMFHVIKTLTNLWRRGLIRNNYFPLIFVCYIEQLFTALMMLSSKRSIFSLSKLHCYGNMRRKIGGLVLCHSGK